MYQCLGPAAQAVGANSTVVINSANQNLTSANINQKEKMEVSVNEISNALGVVVFPNPSASNFIINIKVNTSKEKITMQVKDYVWKSN